MALAYPEASHSHHPLWCMYIQHARNQGEHSVPIGQLRRRDPYGLRVPRLFLAQVSHLLPPADRRTSPPLGSIDGGRTGADGTQETTTVGEKGTG